MKKYGSENILNIFYTSSDFETALEKVTSKKMGELESDWLDYTKNR